MRVRIVDGEFDILGITDVKMAELLFALDITAACAQSETNRTNANKLRAEINSLMNAKED